MQLVAFVRVKTTSHSFYLRLWITFQTSHFLRFGKGRTLEIDQFKGYLGGQFPAGSPFSISPESLLCGDGK